MAKGDWKKRTPAQIAQSVKDKDYTGGYKFFPWLIYMQKGYLLGFLGNFGLGLAAMIATWGESVMFIGAGFAFIAAPLIAFMTIRTYRQMKKGISS